MVPALLTRPAPERSPPTRPPWIRTPAQAQNPASPAAAAPMPRTYFTPDPGPAGPAKHGPRPGLPGPRACGRGASSRGADWTAYTPVPIGRDMTDRRRWEAAIAEEAHDLARLTCDACSHVGLALLARFHRQTGAYRPLAYCPRCGDRVEFWRARGNQRDRLGVMGDERLHWRHPMAGPPCPGRDRPKGADDLHSRPYSLSMRPTSSLALTTDMPRTPPKTPSTIRKRSRLATRAGSPALTPVPPDRRSAPGAA